MGDLPVSLFYGVRLLRGARNHPDSLDYW